MDDLLPWMLVRSAHVAERRIVEALRGLDLTPVQFGILAQIAASSALTRAELARAIEVRPQSAAGVVDGLVGRGLLEQPNASHKGRRNPLSLTATGRDLFERSWRAVSRTDRPEALGLDAPGRDALKGLLREVLAGGERGR